MKCAAALTLFALAAPAAAAAGGQASAPDIALIARQGLSGWSAQRVSGCVDNVSETLTVSQCAGWLRTEKPIFGDYAVTFEMRARISGARAFLGMLGISGKEGRPEYLVGIPLLGSAASPRPSRTRIDALALSAAGRAQAMKPDGEWQSYTVTRNRQGIHVLLNGTQLLSSGPVRASDGWIGFTADEGAFELRGVHLRHLMPPPAVGSGIGPVRLAGELVDGAYRPGRGVLLPKLVREVRPNYSRDALAARIEGAVLIECVVEPDGTVGTATVIRSLDDRYGLDDEALKAAKGWRFQPGTRGGVAVPVWISIELTFTVKK